MTDTSNTPQTPAERSDLATIRTLLPYLWPVGHWDVRTRVIGAVLCMISAKIAVVYVPILFGQAVDSLPSLEGAGAAVTIPLGRNSGLWRCQSAVAGFRGVEGRDLHLRRTKSHSPDRHQHVPASALTIAAVSS